MNRGRRRFNLTPSVEPATSSPDLTPSPIDATDRWAQHCHTIAESSRTAPLPPSAPRPLPVPLTHGLRLRRRRRAVPPSCTRWPGPVAAHAHASDWIGRRLRAKCLYGLGHEGRFSPRLVLSFFFEEKLTPFYENAHILTNLNTF